MKIFQHDPTSSVDNTKSPQPSQEKLWKVMKSREDKHHKEVNGEMEELQRCDEWKKELKVKWEMRDIQDEKLKIIN